MKPAQLKLELSVDKYQGGQKFVVNLEAVNAYHAEFVDKRIEQISLYLISGTTVITSSLWSQQELQNFLRKLEDYFFSGEQE